MQSLDRFLLVDTLLDSLAAERFAPGALLLTIVDELSTGSHAAVRFAEALFERLASGDLPQAELSHHIDALRQLIHRGA